MPTETYTIKIDTVLGSTTGIGQATKALGAAQGQLAVQAGGQLANNVATGVVTAAKKGVFKKAIEFTNAAAKEGLSGGTGLGMLGRLGMYGAVAATAGMGLQQWGVTNTMAQAGMAGGNGLRGQGLWGTLGAVKDWWTGRDTRESMQDLKLAQGDFFTGRAAERGDTYREKLLRDAAVKFTPITEADPVKRIEAERSRFDERLKDMAARKQVLDKYMEEQKKNIWAGRFMDLKTGDRVDSAIAFQQQADAKKQSQAMQDQIESIQSGRRDFEAGNLAEKKSTLQSGLMQWGAMTPLEREFSKNSIQKMKNKQDMAPEEIAAAQANPFAQDISRQYLLDKAMKEGGAEMIAMGDKTYARAAELQLQFGGTVEHHLSEQAMLELEQTMLKKFTEAGNDMRIKINELLQLKGITTNGMQMDRKLVEDRSDR